ncbi:MAG: hypothetical protein ACFFAH_11430 [Promethearchaeota archaeon]
MEAKENENEFKELKLIIDDLFEKQSKIKIRFLKKSKLMRDVQKCSSILYK